MIQAGGQDQERAMHFLYRSYFPLYHQGRFKYKLSADEGFDAYSDAHLALRRFILQGRYRADSSLKTFFYRIFFNKCIDIVRSRSSKKMKEGEMPEGPDPVHPAPDPVRALIQAERIQGLLKLMEELGSKCKDILLLSSYYGYAPDEIADKLGFKNAHTVSSKKFKCLQRLRKLIRQDDG